MARMDLSTKEGRRRQGQKIQAAAEAVGLSLEQLAEEIGCSRALIYQYVSGATLAQPNRLQKIAERTGKPLTYFFADEEVEGEAQRRLQTEMEEARKLKELLEAERTRWQRQRLVEVMEYQMALADAQESPPDWEGLISTCERIVPLARELEDRRAEGRAYFRMGNARLRRGEPEAARASLERAVAIFEMLGERDQELAARQSLGNALAVMGMVDAALGQFQAVAAGEGWWNRWQGMLSIGAVQEQMGEYAEATASFEKAMGIVEENRDEAAFSVGSLYVRANWVNVYLGFGDYPAALEMVEGCLAEAERLGLPDQHIEAQLNAGVCLHHLGRLAEAGERLRRAQALARFLGDRERLGVAWACLGDWSAACGDFGAAKAYGKDALQTALQVRSHRGELLAHLALAHAYASSGDLQEALYHLSQGYSLSRALKAPLQEGWVLAWRAYVLEKAGDLQEAEAVAGRALDLATRLGAQHLEGWARVTRVKLSLRAGGNEEAESAIRRIAELGERTGAVELRWRSFWLLGRWQAAAGQVAEALQSYQEAVDVLQALHQQLLAVETGDTLLEDEERILVYEEMADLLLRSGRAEEARALVAAAEWPPLEARWQRRLKGRGPA